MSNVTNRLDLIDSVNSESIVNITDATYTVTGAQSGSTFMLNRAGGIVITMPDGGGGDIIGATYTFKILTTFSGTCTIGGATTDNLLRGGVTICSTTAGACDVFSPNGSDDHQLSMTAEAEGWLEGGVIVLTCIAADLWLLTGVLGGVGTVSTPFT